MSKKVRLSIYVDRVVLERYKVYCEKNSLTLSSRIEKFLRYETAYDRDGYIWDSK